MTEPTEGDVALSYVTALLDALVDGGVRHMCMTPGSRSTPIALAAARHPDITLHVHLDERSSAFFGLGIAAATGRPVAMFCTSGTAAANHLPAYFAYYSPDFTQWLPEGHSDLPQYEKMWTGFFKAAAIHAYTAK